MKKIIIIFVLLSLLPTTLFAKAYYAGKKEMIKKADAIVIVEIVNTEQIIKKSKDWTYHQKAIGVVEKTLKGNIQENIEIYGMEDFICAQCKFEKGRFLLFLRKNDDFWVCSNWHLSIRPIKNGKIDWLKNDTSPFEMEEKFLEEGIQEVENILNEK